MNKNDYSKYAQDVLGIEFNNIDLLIVAFTHRSYLNEHKKSADEHNERLEFLGDAVLELVVTEHLFTHFDEPEGVLTNWRSALVRTESISAAGAKLDFGSMLRLSKGEKRGSERARMQITANTFEAVIGAIYLDRGYDAAKGFIGDNILSTLKGILDSGSWRDPKSRLQEITQAKESHTPQYKVISEDGPDHEKIFEVGVFVGKTMRGKGSGNSKQIAQQAAARNALEYYDGKK